MAGLIDITLAGGLTEDGRAVDKSDLGAALTIAREALQCVVVTTTRAELNAGKAIVPAQVGYKIRVTNVIARVNGGFDGSAGTSADLRDGAGSPVAVVTCAKAALTNGAVVNAFSSNITKGAGFAVDLTVDKALNANWIGTAADAGTDIKWTVTFQYVT